MERLELEEQSEFEIAEQGNTEVGSDLSLCLVGRFLTDKGVRVNVMMDKMAEIWRPGRGVGIKAVEPGLFLFQFYHQLRILKQGPWSFDRHLLILSVLPEGVVPQEIPLYTVPFWVQVHDLPIGFMSEAVGKGLGDFIGEFLEYDSNNSSNFWRQYMRIRVLVDVRNPLRRMKKIRKQGGEARMVNFKYERLEVYCYLCGMLGHMESGCAKLFSIINDDGSRGWGPTLRAEIRRGGGGARSRWLRDENDTDWKAPNQVFNAGGNMGNVAGGIMGINRREGGFNANSNERSNVGGATRMGNNYGDKVIKVGGAVVNTADIFRDPKMFFPIKESHVNWL